MRAGAEVLVEMLVAQAHRDVTGGAVAAPMPLAMLLEGLGEPIAIEVATDSPAVGKTRAQLDLRGKTGATVLALTRGNSATVMPSAQDRLAAGDVLAVAGTRADIQAARDLLHGAR